MRHVSRDGAIPIALVLFVILSSRSSVEQELRDRGRGQLSSRDVLLDRRSVRSVAAE